jgi:hypothetical protein
VPRNSKRHETVSATEQLAPRNRCLLYHGAYCSMALTVPRHLNFHRFDQIKVAHYQILQTFIKSVEIKVAHYQICGNLGDVEQ